MAEEELEVDGDRRPLSYIFAMVPLDCIDDLSHPDRYNPRKLKPDHRDELLRQIATYGLVNPLVTTLEDNEDGTHRLLLIDGRHRYYSLLEFDERLKHAVIEKALEQKRKRESISISDPERLRGPPRRVGEVLSGYTLQPEDVRNPGSPPMVPVKIYLDQGEVDRIGMAVFLNKGQKKLAGGEEIEKIAKALEEAIREEMESAMPSRPASEQRAVAKVLKTNVRTDQALVVLSRHVAHIMDNDESPWFPVIGRWQGETMDDNSRSKPLTAKNFLAFASELIDTTPQPIWDERQRDREIERLERLGSLFQSAFDWPENIPGKDTRFTATAVLTRSFLIRALGIELNERFGAGEKLLSRKRIPEATWADLQRALNSLRSALDQQAGLREAFEEKKRELKPDSPEGRKREKLLAEVDRLRGRLWSLDTIVPTLRSRLRESMDGE